MKILFILLVIALCSCVSKKKYINAIAQTKEMSDENSVLEDLLNKLAIENDSIKQENDLLDSLLRMERDKTELASNKKYVPKAKSKKRNLTKGQEADKEAVFIYNFTSYVSWPKFNADKFLIGVVGNTRVTDILIDYTKGKSIAKAPIDVQPYKAGVNYQIVFVSADGATNFAKIKKENNGKSVLLITENILYNKIGGHIGFFVDGDKVNFLINKDAIEKAGMHVSAKLVNFSNN